MIRVTQNYADTELPDDELVGQFIDAEDSEVLDSYRNYMILVVDMPCDEARNHMAEKDRHIVHRSIKHRMYAERIARRNAKKGVVCNG